MGGCAQPLHVSPVCGVPGNVFFALFSPEASSNLTNLYLLYSASAQEHMKAVDGTKVIDMCFQGQPSKY